MNIQVGSAVPIQLPVVLTMCLLQVSTKEASVARFGCLSSLFCGKLLHVCLMPVFFFSVAFEQVCISFSQSVFNSKECVPSGAKIFVRPSTMELLDQLQFVHGRRPQQSGSCLFL
jgi:hypothetical protein